MLPVVFSIISLHLLLPHIETLGAFRVLVSKHQLNFTLGLIFLVRPQMSNAV